MAALTILQTNSNHASLPQLELERQARLHEYDILMTSETYDRKIPGYKKVTQGRTSLYTKNRIDATIMYMAGDTIAVQIEDMKVLATYWSPNENVNNGLHDLQSAMQLDPLGKWLVMGDLNVALAPAVNPNTIKCNRKRKRSQLAQTFLDTTNLVVWNDNTPTSYHRGKGSVNDYTLTQHIPIEKWKVLPQMTFSDHQFIQFEIPVSELPYEERVKLTTNLEQFEEMIDHPPELAPYCNKTSTNRNATTITKWLSETIEHCTTLDTKKQGATWWTPELAERKKELTQMMTRLRRRQPTDPAERALLKSTINLKKQEYRKMILNAKEEEWRQFVTRNRAWGRPYKSIVKGSKAATIGSGITKANGTKTRSVRESQRLLLDTKFPHTTNTKLSDPTPIDTTEINYTDDIEIANILRKSNNKSAPGMDGIRYKHLKILHKKHSWILTELYNACLEYGSFPEEWKHSRVAFILKPQKDPKDPAAYRPLSLLSCLGKVFEHIIRERLPTDLDDHQYGFRRKRTAEECINQAIEQLKEKSSNYFYTAAISLDIRGAFDHVLWPCIIKALQEKNTPQYIINVNIDYLKERKATIGGATRHIQCGCPQGSVLGPTHWNLTYDPILRHLRNKGITALAYADDTLLIIEAHTKRELEKKAKDIVKDLEEQLQKIGLVLNKEKTECILMNKVPNALYHSDYDRYAIWELNVCDTTIEIKKEFKYLGVIIDYKLKFRKHYKYLNNKAEKVARKMYPIFRNKYGYGNKARLIMIKGAIHSLYQYASTAHAGALKYRSVCKEIHRVQRRVNIMAARAYRSTPFMVSTILAKMAPLELTIEGRTILYSQKTNRPFTPHHIPPPPRNIKTNKKLLQQYISKEINAQWQKQWSDSKDRWLKTLCPQVPAENDTTLNPNFYLSQALSGHGAFGQYLAKAHKRNSALCTCGLATQNPEHVFTMCPNYSNNRPVKLELNEEGRQYLIETMKNSGKRTSNLIRRGSPNQLTTNHPESPTSGRQTCKKERRTLVRKYVLKNAPPPKM